MVSEWFACLYGKGWRVCAYPEACCADARKDDPAHTRCEQQQHEGEHDRAGGVHGVGWLGDVQSIGDVRGKRTTSRWDCAGARAALVGGRISGRRGMMMGWTLEDGAARSLPAFGCFRGVRQARNPKAGPQPAAAPLPGFLHSQPSLCWPCKVMEPHTCKLHALHQRPAPRLVMWNKDHKTGVVSRLASRK